jgi:gluconolactonase
MKDFLLYILVVSFTFGLGIALPIQRAMAQEVPSGAPSAAVDLATKEGVAAGADSQPSGAPVRTYDYTAHAGEDLDDSRWEAIDPPTLDNRRGSGRIAFNWYRINLTVPERIGSFNPAGSTVVFETSVDDYAEVRVDGELPRAAGQSGGSVVKGCNAANQLVIGRNVKPGQKIQLAVFGINGPIWNPPTNYIYMRYAKLEFYPASPVPYAVTPHCT